MEPVTLDMLRVLARAEGLDLSDEELSGLLPLVESGRAMLDALSAVPLRDVEPASQYRIL